MITSPCLLLPVGASAGGRNLSPALGHDYQSSTEKTIRPPPFDCFLYHSPK